MKGQFQVIDTLRHVIEPPDLWDRWLEPAYKNQGAIRVDESRVAMIVNGRPVSRNATATSWRIPIYRDTYADAVSQDFSPQSHLADMDIEGVDVGLLLPTAGLYAIWSDHIDAELARRWPARTTTTSPTTAAPTRAASRASRCCRCRASRRRSRSCAAPWASLASWRGSFDRTPSSTATCTTGLTTRSTPQPSNSACRSWSAARRGACFRNSARTATPTTASRTRPSPPPTSSGSR